MKKFYLLLTALIMGMFSAHAEDYYITGDFNSWPNSITNATWKFSQSGTQYTITLPATTDFYGTFLIITGSNGSVNWNNKIGGATLSVPGTQYTYTQSGSASNAVVGNSKHYTNATVTFDTSTKKIWFTGKEVTEIEVGYAIYGSLNGGSSWYQTAMTEQSGKWVLADQKVEDGAKFLVVKTENGNISNYYKAPSSDAVVTVGKTITCGNDNGVDFSIAAGTYTFTFDPSNLQLVVTGTSTGETPEIDPYESWWVKCGGEFNNNNFYDGTQPKNGIVTFSDLAITASGFKIAVYPGGGSDIYYIASENPIAVGTWVQLVEDTVNGDYITIEGYKTGNIYTVEFDCATNKVKLTLTKEGDGGGDTPIDPTPDPDGTLYFVGDGSINGTALGWTPTAAYALEGTNGVYTFKYNGNKFKVSTVQDEWDTFNDNGFCLDNRDNSTVSVSDLNNTINLYWGYSQDFELPESTDYTITITVKGSKGSSESTILIVPDGEVTYPETMYVLGTVDGAESWAPNVGYAMTKKANGVFTVSDMPLTRSAGSEYSYFSFTSQLSSDTEWSGLGTRYGAAAGNTEEGDGGTSYLLAGTVGASAAITAAPDPIAFKMNAAENSANSVSFTLDLTTMQLTIDGTTMVEGVVVDNNVAPVYYNLQGVRVDNPTNGLYIVVRGNEVSKQVIR